VNALQEIIKIIKKHSRFIKFAAVGGSGVFVNLGVYALLKTFFGMGLETSSRLLAYAISVEISIITNFLLNDVWTFRDRLADSPPFLTRALRFHLVSLVGFFINWGTFAALNLAFPAFSESPIPFLSFLATLPVLQAPNGDVLFALTGIALATAWNYLGNLRWTWG
jgi:dolichol-phosphate mannosyltransferase